MKAELPSTTQSNTEHRFSHKHPVISKTLRQQWGRAGRIYKPDLGSFVKVEFLFLISFIVLTVFPASSFCFSLTEREGIIKKLTLHQDRGVRALSTFPPRAVLFRDVSMVCTTAPVCPLQRRGLGFRGFGPPPQAAAPYLVAVVVHGHQAVEVEDVATFCQLPHQVGLDSGLGALVAGGCREALHADGAVLRGRGEGSDRQKDRQTSLSQQCQDMGPMLLVSPLDQPPHPGEGREPVPISPDSSHIKMPPGHPIQTPNSPCCSHLIGRMPHLLQVFLQHLLGGFTCGEQESEGPGVRRRRNPREGTEGEKGQARLTLLGLLLGGLAAGVGDARDGLDLAFADGRRVQHQLGRPRQADGQPRRAHQDPCDACTGAKH